MEAKQSSLPRKPSRSSYLAGGSAVWSRAAFRRGYGKGEMADIAEVIMTVVLIGLVALLWGGDEIVKIIKAFKKQ